MKHPETVDDCAVKDASKMQRVLKQERAPEMEDPEGYEKNKRFQKKFMKVTGNRKKEAREDRKKTNIFIHVLEKLRKKK
jgi:hypothetical protein